MAKSLDFYHPVILPDPSLRILERRGIWALGSRLVLLGILIVACLLRLDRLGEERLGPAETCVLRDWQKRARAIEGLERREVLSPLYRGPLRLWASVGSTPWMLRFYSTLWALVLVALVFRLGTIYFNPPVGALAAVLLAVSPPLIATSQDIGPTMEGSVLLAVNLACLLRATFRRANESHWALYLLTGALAVACHPLSVWVIVAQAVLALAFGPREERQGFYGRLVTHAGLIALFAWIWFRSTRSLSPFFAPDWGQPTESGLFSLVRLLGVTSTWGTRVYPSGWLWMIVSIVLIVVPLAAGGFAVRQRQTRDLAGFLLATALAPLAVILLAPRRLIAAHCPMTEVLALTIAPLALWAAVSLRIGLGDRARRTLTIVLVFGGALVALWSSRVQVFPDWESYRTLLTSSLQRGHVVVGSQLARLADFETYLGSHVTIEEIDKTLALAAAKDNCLLVLEARPPVYSRDDPADSPAPLIRTWLEKNCQRQELVRDEFFQLTLWSDFEPAALREAINRETFYDRTAWETLRFVRWFGPFDPGFECKGRTSRVVGSSVPSDRRRALDAPRARWLFDPQVPPGYYHMFIPIELADPSDPTERQLIWKLPNGEYKRQKVTKETRGFSFIWEALVPNERLKITVSTPDDEWLRQAAEASQSRPPLVFCGVGLRQHFPYVVDVGAPFDDLALGNGWHEPQREGEVTYRWTDARAQVVFYLPAAGGIGLEGQLALRVAQRHPDEPGRLKFEVLWDGKELRGATVATPQWDSVRLSLPEPPAPGRHEVLIKSPVFRVPDPADPSRQTLFGLMVDKVSVE